MEATLAETLGRWVAGTPLHGLARELLSTVPGAPPIVQTVHLLSIAAIMGSIVLVDLRVLGLALPSQPPRDLIRRLLPWTWAALPLLAISGLVFVFAQPHRYFANPVFQWKFTLLAPAVALAAAVHRLELADGWLARGIAALSLALWVAIVLAGRWIAYVDYLMPLE